MKVIPVAGRDSLHQTPSGARAPYPPGTGVPLPNPKANKGVGKVPERQKTTAGLEQARPLVVGSKVGDYRNTLLAVKRLFEGREEDVRGQQTYDLRTGIHVLTGLEAPLLDLLGKHLEVPVASLLGEGLVRDRIPVLGYLFFVADRRKTDLSYLAERESPVEWYRLRREEAMNPESIVALAKAAADHYGFSDFKLKGGVLPGEEEIEAV